MVASTTGDVADLSPGGVHPQVVEAVKTAAAGAGLSMRIAHLWFNKHRNAPVGFVCPPARDTVSDESLANANALFLLVACSPRLSDDYTATVFAAWVTLACERLVFMSRTVPPSSMSNMHGTSTIDDLAYALCTHDMAAAFVTDPLGFACSEMSLLNMTLARADVAPSARTRARVGFIGTLCAWLRSWKVVDCTADGQLCSDECVSRCRMWLDGRLKGQSTATATIDIVGDFISDCIVPAAMHACSSTDSTTSYYIETNETFALAMRTVPPSVIASLQDALQVAPPALDNATELVKNAWRVAAWASFIEFSRPVTAKTGAVHAREHRRKQSEFLAKSVIPFAHIDQQWGRMFEPASPVPLLVQVGSVWFVKWWDTLYFCVDAAAAVSAWSECHRRSSPIHQVNSPWQ